MIEIVVLVLLCNKNFKNAKERGKSGGAAIAYTLGLWIGGEILGFTFGIAANGGEIAPPAYIAALLFAIGGGVASYFIAKSGKPAAQYQPQMYPPPPAQQYATYPSQPPQPAFISQQGQPVPPGPNQPPHPAYINQQGQPVPPNPVQQPQPAYINQQGQPMPPHASQPPQPQMQPAQVQGQPGTATITFSAKKAMGQFLVSSVTVEINGVPYQTAFKKPISIVAPAGNVQIACYLNYLGQSGLAQMNVALAPNQSYRLEYKSPMVVTGSGSLEITQA